MYNFRAYEGVINNVKGNLGAVFDSKHQEKLTSLAENPYAVAKKTGMPLIGEYYVNFGKYCLLFDIDDEAQDIILLSVLHRSYLYKVLIGKIKQIEED